MATIPASFTHRAEFITNASHNHAPNLRSFRCHLSRSTSYNRHDWKYEAEAEAFPLVISKASHISSMAHHAAVTTVLSSSWRDPIDRNGSAQLWLAAIISVCDQQVPALTPIAISSPERIASIYPAEA